MTCLICGDTKASLQEVWLEASALVSVGVRGPLCDSCHGRAPAVLQREMQHPVMRSVLLVMGARVAKILPLEEIRGQRPV